VRAKKVVCSYEGLLGELDLDESLASGHHVLVLDTHDATTPLSGKVGVIVELGLELSAELLEVDEVFTTDIGESDASGCLEMDEFTEVGLAADEAEGDTLLSAESGQMDNELNGVDVVGDDNKLGLVLLNECGDVVEAELKVHGLLGLASGFTSGASLSIGLQSAGLLLVGLGSVLGHKLEELGSLVLLEGLGELVDLGRDLESLHEDALLALNSDVSRPSHKSGEVALWLDVASKTEVASILLEETSITSSSATSTSFRFNDFLALSFLHHND
jgi:hypothetical protein